MTNGHLYFKERMYIPPHKQQAIVCSVHDSPTTGHVGHFRIKALLEWNFGARPFVICQYLQLWLHCMPTKQSKSSSHSSFTCPHPILCNPTLQTALSQPCHRPTTPKWTSLTDGQGWPQIYKGGNSHPLFKNHQCSRSSQTFPLPCVQTIWTLQLPNIWQRPTICISLH